MAKELLKGNVAIAEAAIRAGCQAYFGYPITPQTELLEHLEAFVEFGDGQELVLAHRLVNGHRDSHTRRRAAAPGGTRWEIEPGCLAEE